MVSLLFVALSQDPMAQDLTYAQKRLEASVNRGGFSALSSFQIEGILAHSVPEGVEVKDVVYQYGSDGETMATLGLTVTGTVGAIGVFGSSVCSSKMKEYLRERKWMYAVSPGLSVSGVGLIIKLDTDKTYKVYYTLDSEERNVYEVRRSSNVTISDVFLEDPEDMDSAYVEYTIWGHTTDLLPETIEGRASFTII